MKNCHFICLYLANWLSGILQMCPSSWRFFQIMPAVISLLYSYRAVLFLHCYYLWSPCGVGQTTIFLPCSFFFYLSIFFIFPCLISAIADWMSAILPHMMWPLCEFKMQVWNVLHTARWKYRTQKSRQILPSGHHRTILSAYVFATKAHISALTLLVGSFDP